MRKRLHSAHFPVLLAAALAFLVVDFAAACHDHEDGARHLDCELCYFTISRYDTAVCLIPDLVILENPSPLLPADAPSHDRQWIYIGWHFPHAPPQA